MAFRIPSIQPMAIATVLTYADILILLGKQSQMCLFVFLCSVGRWVGLFVRWNNPSVWAGVILSTKPFLIEFIGECVSMPRFSVIVFVFLFHRNWNIKQMKLQTESSRCVNVLPSHLLVHMNLFHSTALDSLRRCIAFFFGLFSSLYEIFTSEFFHWEWN